jgi:hypothetical protein
MYVHTFGYDLADITNYCHMKKGNFLIDVNVRGGYFGYLPRCKMIQQGFFSKPKKTPT